MKFRIGGPKLLQRSPSYTSAREWHLFSKSAPGTKETHTQLGTYIKDFLRIPFRSSLLTKSPYPPDSKARQRLGHYLEEHPLVLGNNTRRLPRFQVILIRRHAVRSGQGQYQDYCGSAGWKMTERRISTRPPEHTHAPRPHSVRS